MRGALQVPVDGGKVRCDVCAHRCKLSEGQVGICRVRKNVGGVIRYTAYDAPAFVCPYVGNCGAGTFCASRPSCNWECTFCTSAGLTQPELVEPIPVTISGFADRSKIRGQRNTEFPMGLTDLTAAQRIRSLSPQDLVEEWKRSGKAGYGDRASEPVIHLEASIDTFKGVRDAGGFVTINSNGYWTPESVAMLAPHLDQVEIGFKGSGNREFMQKVAGVPKMEPVYETIRALTEYPIDILISDIPLFHETWEDDFRALVDFIAETIPPRDCPRLKLYSWLGSGGGGPPGAPGEAFGKFLTGIPDSDGGLDCYSYLGTAARIALERLDSVWFGGPGFSLSARHDLLSTLSDLAIVEEGPYLVRVAKTPGDLGTVLACEESSRSLNEIVAERMRSSRTNKSQLTRVGER